MRVLSSPRRSGIGTHIISGRGTQLRRNLLGVQFKAMAFTRFYGTVGGYFRRRRQAWLLSEFVGCRTVVDLGGTAESWPSQGKFPNITLVNVTPKSPDSLPSGLSYLQADACHTELSPSYDLAYSNSAIEHVGSWERQQEFAAEMRRLGRRIYCQTPNRWFPIETHYLTLFLHWLPRRMFAHRLHRWFTLQGLAERPRPEESAKIRQRESLRLLTRRELQQLFPECHIRVERFLGWPKSYAAWK